MWERPEFAGRQPARLHVAFLSLAVLVVGCGATSGTGDGAYSQLWPQAAEARDSEAHRLGRTLFEALQRGDEVSILMTTDELEELLHPEVYLRMQSRRPLARTGHGGGGSSRWRGTEYLGACFQGVRREPADTALGLRHPAGVVDRVLVVGQRSDGARLATWIEGSLIRTQTGLRAIASLPIEPPRWEHSDLEIAPCDLAVGFRGPL